MKCNSIGTCWWLGWIEWRRSFSCRSPGGGSGRRDFVGLVLLLLVTLTLALFVWSSRKGVLYQFMDVSLGYVPGYGIPIWVVAEVGALERSGIDPSIIRRIDELAIPRLRVFPYREVEPFEVSLPSDIPLRSEVWSARSESFKGRSVAADDPLWLLAMKSVPTDQGHAPVATESPLDIVLSRTLFKENFLCNKYLDILRQRLPSEIVKDMEHAVSRTDVIPDCLQQGIIWMEAQLGGASREVIPFRIHWLEHIPTMEELAFLFPITTHHAFKIALHSPEVQYFPEGGGKSVERIGELFLWTAENEPQPQESIDALLRCLRGAEMKGNLIRLNNPRSQLWITACVTESGIPIADHQTPAPPYLQVARAEVGDPMPVMSDGSFRLPCEKLNPSWRIRYRCEGAEEIELIPSQALGGFPRAIVYLPERARLFSTVEALRDLKEPEKIVRFGRRTPGERKILAIHPIYQDALIRFNFISDVLDILDSYYSLFFLLVLVVSLLVQLSFVVFHRRQAFGIFLAKGLPWTGICLMLTLQVVISVAVAFAGSVLFVLFVRFFVNLSLVDLLLSEPYVSRISSELDLLPISVSEFFLGALLVLLICCGLAFGLFVRVCPPRRTEPSALLHK